VYAPYADGVEYLNIIGFCPWPATKLRGCSPPLQAYRWVGPKNLDQVHFLRSAVISMALLGVGALDAGCCAGEVTIFTETATADEKICQPVRKQALLFHPICIRCVRLNSPLFCLAIIAGCGTIHRDSKSRD
jgi:hypothetical protein